MSVENINGTIRAVWTRPIVQPSGTEFQLIRSTNSIDASVGTVVWQGVAQPVALVMPTSPHWYYVRAIANSAFSAYTPNTFGLLAIPRLEADNTLQGRLCGDAEFEFGQSASLWQAGNFSETGAFNNRPGLAVVSYHATGGQFAGYLNLQAGAVVHSATFEGPTIFGVNVNNSLGYPGAVPYAIEYSLRLRVNSRPSGNLGITGANIRLGVALHYSTPDSVDGIDILGGTLNVMSSELPLGEWTSIRKLTVVRGPIQVESTYRFYSKALVAYVGSGNVDFDLFQATALGFVNHPVTTKNVAASQAITELDAMNILTMTNSSIAGTISFQDVPSWITGDWRRFQPGRRFQISKAHTAQPVFICPASGMSLMLAGRAAVGTVTMVASLVANATIENVDGVNFVVNGSGLT